MSIIPGFEQTGRLLTEKPRNYKPRAGAHYLRKWYKYQQNLNYLKDHEIVMAKILFSALNDLTEEERTFLASKYCVPLKKKNGVSVRPKDADLANHHAMSLSEYSRKRTNLEEKMSRLIARYETKYEEEYEESLWFKGGTSKRGGGKGRSYD